MAVVRFADRARRWGPGASSSGCWVCGEGVGREDTAVGLDIGMLGYALAHVPCANRLSLWLLEDVAHSHYSFLATAQAERNAIRKLKAPQDAATEGAR